MICLRLYLSCPLTQTCLLSLPDNQAAVQSRPQGPFLLGLGPRGSFSPRKPIMHSKGLIAGYHAAYNIFWF